MSVLALLAACGNKGPLVLPQKPVDVPTTPVEPSQQDDAPAATGAAASGSTNTAKPADPPKQDDGD